MFEFLQTTVHSARIFQKNVRIILSWFFFLKTIHTMLHLPKNCTHLMNRAYIFKNSSICLSSLYFFQKTIHTICFYKNTKPNFRNPACFCKKTEHVLYFSKKSYSGSLDFRLFLKFLYVHACFTKNSTHFIRQAYNLLKSWTCSCVR